MSTYHKPTGLFNGVMMSSAIFKFIVFLYIFIGIISSFYLFSHLKLFTLPVSYELWLSLLYGYWIVFSFILIQIGLGSLILRIPIFHNADLPSIPFLIFSFGVGFYLSNCLLTFMALFKWLHSYGIFFYVLISIPLLILGFKSLYNSLYIYIENKETSSDLTQKKRWMIWLVVFFLLLWILPYFFQTILPNTDWDGAWQHLPLPKLYLEKGISWVMPGFMQFDFPGAVHLVYSLFFLVKSEASIIPFNFLIAIGIVITSYYFAYHFFGKSVALWTAAIISAVNIMWEVSLTPRIDSFLAFFCLLAVFSLFLWIQDNRKSGFLIIASMMLGMALGIKYTAVFFIAALMLIGIVHMVHGLKTNPNLRIIPLILVVVFLIIPSGWWYARNAVKLGDPIYPFLSNTIFFDSHGNKLKFYPALYDHLKYFPPREEVESVLNETGLHVFTDYEDVSFTAPDQGMLKLSKKTLFNIWDIFVNPDKYSRKPFHEITPMLLLFIVLPFFDRNRLSLYMYFIGIFIYVFLAAKSHILRYALPLFPLFAVGSARVLAGIRFKPVVFIMILTSVFFLFRFSFLEAKKLGRMDPIPYLSGNLERTDWLIKVGYNWDRTTPPLIKFINEQVHTGVMENDDVIFMIGEGKGNLLKCRYLPDSSRNTLPWLVELIQSNNDYLKIKSNLNERGINYLAINYYYLYWCFKNSRYDKKPLVFGLYHLQQFLEKHTEIIYNNDGMVLAKIKS